MNTVFFSWQSDLPNKTNRNLIESSIKKAIKNTGQKNVFSPITEVDRDTKGVLGSPDIVDSILSKIDKCGLFIADISIINQNIDGKKTPNPNVLFELGYAVKSLGWERIVCVFNSDFGNISDLPFDLRNRRILTYETTNLPDTKRELSKVFQQIIEKNFEVLEQTREISDYYSIKIYSCFIDIISKIINVLYGNDTPSSIENISKILNTNTVDIQKMAPKQWLGFNLFGSYDEQLNILINELDRITSINIFNTRLYIPLIQLIKELKSHNLFINRNANFDKFKTKKCAKEIYNLIHPKGNDRFPNRYILGKKINNNENLVVSFNDIKRKDHIQNALCYYILEDSLINYYCTHYTNIIKYINNFIDINNGLFLIDNTEILIKRIN